MDSLAYKLIHSWEHRPQGGYDATLIEFEGWERTAGLLGIEHLEIPTPVVFEADFPTAQKSDYPCNDRGWPLMSRRMLDVLGDVGAFPHRCIPVVLANRRVIAEQRYTSDGEMRAEAVDDRFTAVQLTSYLDALDKVNSIFTQSEIGGAMLYVFERLALVEPENGFPPLFRLDEDASHLLVSADARRALEDADIRGVAFEPLPGMGPAPQRD